MIDKVIVITREGKQISLTEWQKLYNLTPGSHRIGEFFWLQEDRFKKDIEMYGELIVNEMLIRFLDGLRKASNHPINLNAFNRSEQHQQNLKAKGFRAAEVSPHVVRRVKTANEVLIHGAVAGDVDTLSKDDTYALVKTAKEVSSILKIKVRMGYEDYLKDGSTFVHFDTCPEYYAPGKPWHHLPHPAAWEKVITW